MAEKKSKQIEKTARGGMVPFEDVDRWFEELSRAMFDRRWLSPFERFFPSFPELRAPFEGRMPKVDVIDREAEIVIRGELPGVAKDDLEVSMTDDAVTIRASTRHEEKEEKGEYRRRELSRGEFQRVVALPAAVKGAEAKANFKDGILELVLPKLEPAKRRTIKVA
ncbi:MAG: Hsp20/alpha crystallin family protein [Gammaproteobacteria bacterium]